MHCKAFTDFYNNNRLDIALIGKRLNNNKLGKLGINKETGEVRHITKSRNADKENERILNRDKKDPLAKSPYFAHSIAKEAGATADGAQALSKGSDNYQKPSNFGVLRYNKLLQAGGLQPTGLNETLPEKSLNLLELLKQKQEKEKLAFKNFKEQKMKLGKDKPQKDLKQQFNELVRANQAEQKAKDDRIKDFKDRMINLGKEKGNPLKEFGTNYPEYYHKGKEAISKLLSEKQGQVAGAFYREDIGDITLAWGKEGTSKSDGWGLAKITKYHPEVLDKMDELVEKMPIVKQSANRYQLENENYKIAIRKDYEGEKQNWVLTAFEKKESIVRRRTDLPNTSNEADKKATLSNTLPNHNTNLANSQATHQMATQEQFTSQSNIVDAQSDKEFLTQLNDLKNLDLNSEVAGKKLEAKQAKINEYITKIENIEPINAEQAAFKAKMLYNLNALKNAKNSGQIQRYTTQLKKDFNNLGYELVDYEKGVKFNDGMNVNVLETQGKALNDNEQAYIKEVVQPTILKNGEIVQKASIVKEYKTPKAEALELLQKNA